METEIPGGHEGETDWRGGCGGGGGGGRGDGGWRRRLYITDATLLPAD